MMWSDVEWCGVMWSDMGWYGVMWSRMESYGVIWSGMEWYGVIWSDMSGNKSQAISTIRDQQVLTHLLWSFKYPCILSDVFIYIHCAHLLFRCEWERVGCFFIKAWLPWFPLVKACGASPPFCPCPLVSCFVSCVCALCLCLVFVPCVCVLCFALFLNLLLNLLQTRLRNDI